MRTAALRILISTVLLSGWLILLFVGRILGGAVHLLLVASLAVFPWKILR